MLKGEGEVQRKGSYAQERERLKAGGKSKAVGGGFTKGEGELMIVII